MYTVSTYSEDIKDSSAGEQAEYRVFKHLPIFKPSANDSIQVGVHLQLSFPRMSHVPATDDPDSEILLSVIEHVFLPLRLPQAGPSEETEHKSNVALCNSLVEAARDFLQIVPSSQRPLWKHMTKMMELACRAAIVPFEEADLQRVFSDMAVGGMLILSAICFAFGLKVFFQTYFPCLSVPKTLRLLCAGLPLPTSFSLRCLRSRQ